jgi:anti-anti-sigma factor
MHEDFAMKMEITERPDGLLAIALDGRLDTPGVESIELKLTNQTVPRGARALVDLKGVEFVGSLAIRMFITLARALAKRRGALVLHSPQPLVHDLFETVALQQIIPVYPDASTAAAAAAARPA